MPAVVIGSGRAAAAVSRQPWDLMVWALQLLERLHRSAEPGNAELPPEFYKYPPV